MAILVSDTFNRVALTPGTPETGSAWSVISGAWDVNGTTIGETNGQDGGVVLTNAGASDVTAECRFWCLGGMKAGTLIVRATSTGTPFYNLDVWTSGEIRIMKNVNAAQLAATAAGVWQAGDLIALRVTEEAGLTRLRAYRNGTEILNVTDNAGGRPSGTYVGLRHAAGNTNYVVRVSDFHVKDGADAPNSTPITPQRSFGTSWEQAKNAQATRPARIMWEGDSIFEGWGASTRPNRPAQKFLDLIRGGATGGEGYIPAYYIHNQSWKRSFVVATNSITDGVLYGLGERHYQWANTATATLTFTGTHIDLLWRGGGGTFSYSINGGSATTVNTAGNSNDANMEGRRTRLTLGAAASRTIRIARTAGTVTLEGAICYNGDLAAGYTLLDWTHSGWYSQDAGDHGFTTLAPHIRDFQPSLVVFELTGANNYLWNNTTPAANAANVQARLDRYLALPSQPDILLVIPRITSGPNSGTRTWAEYADLVAGITHQRIRLLDLRSNSAVSLGDGVHPNDAGHAAMAQAVYDALQATAITGTLAASIPASTAAVSGASANPGTLAAATPPATFAAAGSATNPGTLTAALPRLAAAVAGQQVNPGVLAGGLPNLTGTLTGESTNPAALTASLPVIAGTLTGTAVNPATLASTLPKLAAQIADVATNPGTLSGTLPAPTGVVVGQSANPATLAGTLPKLTGALNGVAVNPASLSGALPTPIGSIAGQSANPGTLNGTLPRPTGSIVSTDTNPATINSALPLATAAITGTAANSGSLNVALPKLLGGVSDQTVNAGILAATLPAVLGLLPGQSTNPGTTTGTVSTPTGNITGTSRTPGALAATLPRPTSTLTGVAFNSGLVASVLPMLTGLLAETRLYRDITIHVGHATRSSITTGTAARRDIAPGITLGSPL